MKQGISSISPTKPRRGFPIVLFAALMVLDASAFLIEKSASVHAEGQGFELFLAYVRQPRLWAIFALKLSQLVVWTRILTRVDIARAFPLTAISTPLTMIAALVIFHEHPSPGVWIGALLIAAGVALMGRHEEPRAGSDPLRDGPSDTPPAPDRDSTS